MSVRIQQPQRLPGGRKRSGSVPRLVLVAASWLPASIAGAAGTLAGTDIDNTADVSYLVGGVSATQASNTVTISVDEVLDVSVVLQSPQVIVSSPQSNATLLFTVTNTGNGPEVFELSVDNTDAGEDFDPVAASPNIYFDSDASGDLTVADVAYVPGSNDPLLAADESIAILVVNNIPASLNNGDLGRSSLAATAATGSGTPGTVYSGAGTSGVDAVVGTSGATASVSGEYLVSDVTLTINKSALVTDQLGGTSPVPGATLSYTITVSVSGTGTATGLVIDDPIPANTTYSPGTLTLNGGALSDAADTDNGEYDATVGSERITVQIGDLDATDPVQTVGFSVVID